MENKENIMITDWLDEHGNPEIYKKVEDYLEKTTKPINNKLTAVRWFINELHKLNVDFECGLIPKSKYWDKFMELDSQAIEMESQQHLAIYNEGMKKSEGMMNFLYTEIEGRADSFQNGRHKD
jgi:hypothetical protein